MRFLHIAIAIIMDITHHIGYILDQDSGAQWTPPATIPLRSSYYLAAGVRSLLQSLMAIHLSES